VHGSHSSFSNAVAAAQAGQGRVSYIYNVEDAGVSVTE
jgi:hypothetical protein